MGNYNSYQSNRNNQTGGMYSDNFQQLQENIRNLVKNSNHSTVSETIAFNNSSVSSIDFDSIRDLHQSGGDMDFLTVKPKQRYVEPDLSFLKTSIDNNNNAKLSVDSNSDIKFVEELISNYSKQAGGCGCGLPNDGFSETSPFTPQPVNVPSPTFNILNGGAKKQSDTSDQFETETDDEDDNEDSLNDDDDDDDDEDTDDDDEDDEDDDTEDSGMERMSNKSSSSNSSTDYEIRARSRVRANMNGVKKNHKKSKKQISSSSQNGGSDSEIIIDTKYLYSSTNNFTGSDSSDHYGHFRNRSVLR